jgi:hypothetical protein
VNCSCYYFIVRGKQDPAAWNSREKTCRINEQCSKSGQGGSQVEEVVKCGSEWILPLVCHGCSSLNRSGYGLSF